MWKAAQADETLKSSLHALSALYLGDKAATSYRLKAIERLRQVKGSEANIWQILGASLLLLQSSVRELAHFSIESLTNIR